MSAVTDGALNRRAVSMFCPVCAVVADEACVVDPDARPYPSTMRIGCGDPFHIARSQAADGSVIG